MALLVLIILERVVEVGIFFPAVKQSAISGSAINRILILLSTVLLKTDLLICRASDPPLCQFRIPNPALASARAPNEIITQFELKL